MKRLNVLVVDDDKLNREMVGAAFQGDGHLVSSAASIRECRNALEAGKPDIIILDRVLPDGDGLQLCLTLKKDSLFKAIPILMLTGKSDVGDKVLGLRFGADDYLAKPFDIEELLARVDAIIRRVHGELSATLTRAGITMDLKAHTVTLNGEPVELTNKEFSLLRVFMESPDTVLTRDAIIETIWTNAGLTGTKVVDVTVMNLRRKLGGEESPICAVRSCGYKLIS